MSRESLKSLFYDERSYAFGALFRCSLGINNKGRSRGSVGNPESMSTGTLHVNGTKEQTKICYRSTSNHCQSYQLADSC